MNMNGAGCVPDHARGGRTDQIVTDIRFMRSDDDTIKTMFVDVIDNLAMGFAANDIRGDSVKMRRFLPQDLGGPIESLLDDVFANIGGDGTLRHLEYMQGDNRTSRRQKRPGDLQRLR